MFEFVGIGDGVEPAVLAQSPPSAISTRRSLPDPAPGRPPPDERISAEEVAVLDRYPVMREVRAVERPKVEITVWKPKE